MEPNQFDLFLSGVRAVAEELAPRLWRVGEDAPTVLFIERTDGSCGIIPVEPRHMASSEAKLCWCIADLPAILHHESAQRYAISAEAWVVKPEARQGLSSWWAEGHTTLSVHPSRAEALVIVAFDRERRVMLENRLRRVCKRRRLTRWEVASEGGDIDGRLAFGVEALVDPSGQH